MLARQLEPHPTQTNVRAPSGAGSSRSCNRSPWPRGAEQGRAPRQLLDVCRCTLGLVQTVALPTREHMDVVMPHVLVASRFVVLTSRDAITREGRLHRER